MENRTIFRERWAAGARADRDEQVVPRTEPGPPVGLHTVGTSNPPTRQREWGRIAGFDFLRTDGVRWGIGVGGGGLKTSDGCRDSHRRSPMEGTGSVVRPSWLGRVEIGEPGALMSSPGPGPGPVMSRTRHTWRPGPELEARLPQGFRLEIDGLTGPAARAGSGRRSPSARSSSRHRSGGLPWSRGSTASTPKASRAMTPCG